MPRIYVATALSNEAPYLLEWVAHYRGIGFDGAILFTHDCEDGTDAMVARLAEMGHVHAVALDPAKTKDPMRAAMRDLPAVARGLGADWCLAAHIDEFLQVSAGDGTVSDLIIACRAPDAIAICRRAFGSSGHRGIPAGQLRESHRLTTAPDAKGPMVARGIKTLFQLGSVARVAPHRPFFPEGATPKWLDGGGKPMPGEYLAGKWTAHDGFSHTHARLHYYPIPSPEAAMIRGGVPEDEDARKAFESDWRKLDQGDVADDAMGRAVGLSDPVLAAFHADEVLQKLQQKGRA